VELHPEALHHAGCGVGTLIVGPLVQRCHARTAGLGIAVADWIVLVALVIVIPPISETSSRGATNLCRVTMA
jgi:hypothetical protein